MGKVGQLGVEMWFVLQTILTFWWILYSFGQISWVRKEINSVKHLGTWCLSSQHTQDSTVRVELSGAELGDADLKAGRERAWQTHFLFYARTFPKAFSLLLAFPCFFLFQIFVQEAQVSFHQFPSCVSFGSLELSVSALLCRIYCCIIVYFCVSFYFTQSFIFRVFFSFSRVFPSLTACPESEFHDASRSWCSTLMITCSDTRMRTAALHLPTSVFLRSFQLDSRLSATYCLFFSPWISYLMFFLLRSPGHYAMNIDLSCNSYVTDSGVASHLVPFLQKWQGIQVASTKWPVLGRDFERSDLFRSLKWVPCTRRHSRVRDNKRLTRVLDFDIHRCFKMFFLRPICQRLKLYKNALGDPTIKAQLFSFWICMYK